MRGRVAVSGVAAFCLVAACSDPGEVLDACQRVEAVGYPDMEKLAAAVLEDLEYRFERVGTCEDTGEPGTVLYAYVREWDHRKVANRYFLDRGWTRTQGRLTSPDGAYEVHNVTSRHGDFPESFVTVHFREVRQTGSP